MDDWLRDHGIPRGAREDAVLVTSELATNAIQHAVTPFQVAVSLEEDAIMLRVSDLAPGRPNEMRPGRPSLRPHGRGLTIVQAVAVEWGVDVLDPGKGVWVRPPL